MLSLATRWTGRIGPVAEERNARRLTTVLAADVAGYSRLMSDDEAATVKTLGEFLEIFHKLIARHDGRVINTAGDGFIAEFGSPVEAMRCAISVQEELGVRNEELPEHRRMHFRIGINVGDVIVEDDQMFGDAVNIAARLEALAEPGRICISGSAFEHVKNRLSVGFREEGAQSVKNIPYPIPAYTVVAGGDSRRSGLAKTGGGKRGLVMASLLGLALLGGAGAGAWALLGDDGEAERQRLKIQQAEAAKREAAAQEAARLRREQVVAEARRKAEEAERRRKQAEQRLREAEAARRKAEAEARRREIEEAKRNAAAEARRKAEAEAQRKLRLLEEAKRRAEEEAKRRAEAEARRRAAEEARRKAEEEARRKAAEEARRRAEEEARRKAAEEAKRKAEEEAKRQAAEDAKRKAAEEAKRKAAAAAEARRRAAQARARRQRQLAEARRRARANAAPAPAPPPGPAPQAGSGGLQPGQALSPAQIRQTLVGRTAAFRRKHRFRPGYVFFALYFQSASRFSVQCRYQETSVRRRGTGQPCRLNGRSFSWSQTGAGACWAIRRPICFRVIAVRGGRVYRFAGGGLFGGIFYLR